MTHHHQDRPSAEGRWVTLEHETLGVYSIFSLTRSLCESPLSGARSELFRLEAPDWVNVIALTDDSQIILVRQFRHGSDAMVLEIPGGAIDPGESPVDAAERELAEETGYAATELLEIGSVAPNPAFLSNRCYTYLALDCRPVGPAAPDPGEEIWLELAPLSELTALIDAGRIDHALVVAAHDHLERALKRDLELRRRILGRT